MPPDWSIVASCSRLRSPPDRVPTFCCWSAPLKLNAPQYARAFTSRLPTLMTSRPPLMISYTVLFGSKLRIWST